MKDLFNTWGYTPWLIGCGVVLVVTVAAYLVEVFKDRRYGDRLR